MNREHKRLVERLESSAEDLYSYLGKFTEQDLLASPAPNEWSIHEIISHLRDNEEIVFLFRAKKIIADDNPAVPNFEQDIYQREHYLATEPLKKMLSEFRSSRKKQVALLRKTKDKDWSRTAQHPEYGTISLEWLVRHCVDHTFEHLAQIGYSHEDNLLRSLNR